MAHRRKLIYVSLVAICYLVGATWAETGTLNITNASDAIAGNNKNAPSSAAPAAPTPTKNVTLNVAGEKDGMSVLLSSTTATKVLNNVAAAAGVLPTSTTTLQTNIKQNSISSNGTSTTASTTPKCVCDGGLLPRLGDNGKELEICPDCKCKHESRNTTLIKVVVIIVIWIISILVIYMLFLMCLDPLLNKRVKANYQEHTNEDDDPTTSTPPFPTTPNQELNARANVLNRVGHQQDKWKRQVREQRRHIYDRRTMLN